MTDREHIPLKACLECGKRSYMGNSWYGISTLICCCGFKIERIYNEESEHRLDSLDKLKEEWNNG